MSAQHSKTQRHGPRRALAVLLLLAVITTGTASSGTTPAASAAANDACPSHDVPATAFTDTTRSVHRAAIDCLLWWEVTSGRTESRYGVAENVTRGQTAAMIIRLLEQTTVVPRPAPSAGFTDTVGHRFSDAIDELVALNIVTGRTATTFEPDAPTTRAQMATIIVGMLEQGYSLVLPTGTPAFTDVTATNPHRQQIGQLVAAGVVDGTSATTYHPHRNVTRGQMASFVTRSTTQVVAAGIATLPQARPAHDDAYASRVRGTWVHLFDPTLKSRASIARMIDELVLADINTLIVQVARRHDAYYASTVLPATRDPQLQSGLDILAEILPRAQANGIKVHAWISVAPSWHGIYDSLGITPDQLGADVSWRTQTRSGGASTYLDPGVLAVQQHVVDIVAELATNYDLDGIHLDYVRYESNQHGYHPDALARFRTETGATGTPTPTDWQWLQWRRAQTRQVITRARAAVRAANPSTELSAATISWLAGPATADRAGFMQTRSYRDVLQDWDGWVRDAQIDTAFPMNYFRDHDPAQAAGFTQWLAYERALRGASQARVVSGIAGYLNYPQAALRQIHRAMQHTDGALVYSYQQPTNDHSRELWGELAATRWGYPPQPLR